MSKFHFIVLIILLTTISGLIASDSSKLLIIEDFTSYKIKPDVVDTPHKYALMLSYNPIRRTLDKKTKNKKKTI